MSTRIPGWIKNSTRNATQKYLTETCDIDVEITEINQYGTPVKPAWTRVQSAVACQRITAGAVPPVTAEFVGNQESIEDQIRVVLPAGTTISVNYRLTIAGRYYYAVRIIDDRSAESDVQVIVSRNR